MIKSKFVSVVMKLYDLEQRLRYTGGFSLYKLRLTIRAVGDGDGSVRWRSARDITHAQIVAEHRTCSCVVPSTAVT